MFHAFDNVGPGKALHRADWIALLSRAPVDLLESVLAPHCAQPPQWLRAPETGLMMVQGRAGATGERFNLGEVTVTRCAIRIGETHSASALVGVAYVLGRSHRQARLAATADALLQNPAQQARIDATLLAPVRQHLALQRTQRQARAQSTKVEFFTVARESGTPGEEEENE
ncbi:MAG TPA: phosphonate C-P lyase system protein PhnG [Rhodoferax sp.]|jgi:alpha-D-ribose 1-methylphosphonate 5-triphosphate synthase subunit PhnG|nr:phosphonate C-P lyase system protein PhnG [Rhodoferax sp.]